MASGDVTQVEAGASEMLQPGANIRPIMTKTQGKELVESLYGLKVCVSNLMASD